MKISIITPVYNAANTLEKTIQSVISQKLRSQLQYIIIDGGSTDGSIEIIERYLDKIDIFISEKDQGVYDAMNKGISYATGDIIGIINADDWYNDRALEIVENTFIAEPDISIIYSPIKNYTKVFLPLGACLDFFSGITYRGPRWMTDRGLEWVSRLFTEPRRLWRRYLIGNFVFLYRILLHYRTDRVRRR